jgi:hypothetical protein
MPLVPCKGSHSHDGSTTQDLWVPLVLFSTDQGREYLDNLVYDTAQTVETRAGSDALTYDGATRCRHPCLRSSQRWTDGATVEAVRREQMGGVWMVLLRVEAEWHVRVQCYRLPSAFALLTALFKQLGPLKSKQVKSLLSEYRMAHKKNRRKRSSRHQV